jgi:acyl-[acyl-carrier-protein] desaturase
VGPCDHDADRAGADGERPEVMDKDVELTRDRAMLAELAEPTAALLERHLSVARTWYPFEDVPWDHATDFSRDEWDEGVYPLSEGVRSAIIVNLLTEDNLPYYTHSLLENVPDDHPLREWSGRWTAEEWRHSAAMRDWVLATRAIDPWRLEDDRMVQMTTGIVPRADLLSDTLAYVSFQELATQVAHRNTGQALDRTLRGKKIMSQIAGDEGLHHAFYRDLASAAIEIDPNLMVIAICRRLREFQMPGQGIPGFAAHEQAIALAGIFDATQYVEQVVQPTLAAWRLDELEGLDSEAERARDKIRRTVSALTRIARVLTPATVPA